MQVERFSSLIVAAVFLCSINAAFSATRSPKDSQALELKKIHSEIESLEDKIKSSTRVEASITSELGKLEKLLKLQALEIRLSQIEIDKLETELQENTVKKDSLEQALETRRSRLRKALSVLYATKTNTPFAGLSSEDAINVSQFKELIGSILKNESQEIQSLKGLFTEVSQLSEKLNQDRDRFISQNEDLKEKQNVLELNQKLKKELLSKTRSEQKKIFQAIEVAKSAEIELESMLSNFNLRKDIEEKSAQNRIANADKGLSFFKRKGGLRYPIQGKIVNQFGKKYDEKTNLYTFHKGIDFSAQPNSRVYAVGSGKVVFSGKIGGYGNLVIIDHGEQYFSLVGQLDEIYKKEGDSVYEGELVGLSNREGKDVYFEIRQRHVAVNPVPWFAKNTK
ncbi:MAG: peptidoglycan DD-metalloendopeptidase family protein [Oligoflexia bacterium]|nr:peptidoglycan DD-metalloendopeptidase family protein [Oligoflexia bacterium]